MRKELDRRIESLGIRIDGMKTHLETVEREGKKRELESWGGILAQVARNHARVKDVEGKMNAITERLDALGVELRELRDALGDEAAVPWTPLALPAPA